MAASMIALPARVVGARLFRPPGATSDCYNLPRTVAHAAELRMRRRSVESAHQKTGVMIQDRR